jgi:hypothetical protein
MNKNKNKKSKFLLYMGRVSKNVYLQIQPFYKFPQPAFGLLTS